MVTHESDNLTTHLFSIHDAACGVVLVVTSRHGVCRVELGDDVETLKESAYTRFSQLALCEECIESEMATRHQQLASQAIAMVDQSITAAADFPLDLEGTDFQKEVWDGLRSIPFGETTTYQNLAMKIGRPTSVRAVANACGANPVAVLIPCHRVLRTDGGIGGYRWGVAYKRALLSIEASISSQRQGVLFES